MITDFRSAEDGAEIETDLCIIGAGAAGITLARTLADSAVRVCVLESGGFEFEPEVQDLYVGENVGHPYYDLDIARLRFFGGTTNHWTGLCGPLAPLDFEKRPWVPHSGWPIDRATLAPFYRRAQAVCEVGPFGDQLWEALGKQPAAFDPAEIDLCFIRHSPPVRFGEAYRQDLARAENVQVLLHANVVNLQADDSGSRVNHVDVRSLAGKAAKVRANTYVLACGGIENPRLLLASDGVEPAGLGNRHDLVGRFFMEHPHTEPAIVISGDAEALEEIYGRLQEIAGGGMPDRAITPTFCAGAEVQRREEILNAQAFILHVANFDSGIRAARQLWWAVRNGGVPDDLAEKVWRVMRDLDEVTMFAYERYTTGRRPFDLIQTLGFSMRSEQAPNPDSRVRLGGDRDALGLRRVELDWQLTERDKQTVLTFSKTLGAEFARLGLGRVRVADWVLKGEDKWSTEMIGGNHHMGTTRMAADPKQGVVDADCRVHGIDNLYIAGSSVFSTGGCINPTFTIVALTLRLADHLRGRLT